MHGYFYLPNEIFQKGIASTCPHSQTTYFVFQSLLSLSSHSWAAISCYPVRKAGEEISQPRVSWTFLQFKILCWFILILMTFQIKASAVPEFSLRFDTNILICKVRWLVLFPKLLQPLKFSDSMNRLQLKIVLYKNALECNDGLRQNLYCQHFIFFPY